MAYAESIIGGNYGTSFRVWVNSIRVYDGSPNENFEQWRCEGGINRVSATGNTIWSDGASYTTQLGLNGVAVSAGFSYNFNTATGRKVAWGTGTTTVYRDGAGNGFGFQSRTDVNLNNSPYLTAGWVTSNDGLNTRPRHLVLTGISTDAGGIPFNDEDGAWVEFSNPSGQEADAFIDVYGYGRLVTNAYVGSRWNFDYSVLTDLIQQSSPNSNTFDINIGVIDHVGGGDTYDYRQRSGYIKNDHGQANPIFTDFTYADINAATVAVTGSNQVLVAGRSTLQTTVPVANKATPVKHATMNSYTFLLGAYSQSANWSDTADVVQNMGSVVVTGTQNLSVRAVDSRGNSATATKAVTVLPYLIPGFYTAMNIKYANDFDATGGISITLLNSNNARIGAISPMTLNGVNKNSINATSGLQYDISKGNNTSYSGTWNNISTTTSAAGGIDIDPAAFQLDLLNKMNALGADNTVRWYIKFKITDKLDSNTFETYIDIGRPIFRIGTDNTLYYREFPMGTPGVLVGTSANSLTPDTGLYGTYKYTALTTNININNPINAFEGRKIMFVLRDNGTARGIFWDTMYRNVGATMPLATIPGKNVVVGAVYNATDSKWDVVAVSQES